MPFKVGGGFIWEVPAGVVRVIDGDTILVEADLGWHVAIKTAVRVDGINAPELKTPEGLAAKKYAQGLLPVGTPVSLLSKELLGAFDKYGRVLADLLYAPSADPKSAEGSFARAMIAAGHAVPWDGHGSKP